MRKLAEYLTVDMSWLETGTGSSPCQKQIPVFTTSDDSPIGTDAETTEYYSLDADFCIKLENPIGSGFSRDQTLCFKTPPCGALDVGKIVLLESRLPEAVRYLVRKVRYSNAMVPEFVPADELYPVVTQTTYKVIGILVSSIVPVTL
jgi:hypothetical protein